ncbi:hypothetical protein GGR57DRAFT_497646 [Xylariaceae sp. FL1272]|nr:hypothetical protein GGR57DRAFT_497646 [Xylariaceae sp. FL1272]
MDVHKQTSMSFPHQCLSPLGQGTLFAASKGTSIHIFDLSANPRFLSSWNHPSSELAGTGEKTAAYSNANGEEAGDGPPSKRRKMEGEDEATINEVNIVPGPQEAAPNEGKDATVNEGKKNKKNKKANWTLQNLEAPYVILLAATEGGSHLVAVTGQDKTLWVFEHNGKGSLKELSQRAMPKRPCSLAFTADGQTILSADKFGDVYALPLITPPDQEAVSMPGSTPAFNTVSQPLHGANAFTVHSQRNLRALEHQKRQREANKGQDTPKEGPSFAHELLLGHVSLLTCVISARDSQGRPYIITGDRDEHIRVSRGMPQAHVIETYCLGHSSFVNALCLPHPGILVSGGGDNELLVWNWLAGKLLSRVDLLARVQEVIPDASKIAVVKLCVYEVEGECYIIAICEKVPALFSFKLQDNELSPVQTFQTSGNALDVMVLNTKVLVTIDSDASLIVLAQSNGILTLEDTTMKAGTSVEDPVIPKEDLDKALYSVENLRKGHDGTAEADESVAPLGHT